MKKIYFFALCLQSIAVFSQNSTGQLAANKNSSVVAGFHFSNSAPEPKGSGDIFMAVPGSGRNLFWIRQIGYRRTEGFSSLFGGKQLLNETLETQGWFDSGNGKIHFFGGEPVNFGQEHVSKSPAQRQQ